MNLESTLEEVRTQDLETTIDAKKIAADFLIDMEEPKKADFMRRQAHIAEFAGTANAEFLPELFSLQHASVMSNMNWRSQDPVFWHSAMEPDITAVKQEYAKWLLSHEEGGALHRRGRVLNNLLEIMKPGGPSMLDAIGELFRNGELLQEIIIHLDNPDLELAANPYYCATAFQRLPVTGFHLDEPDNALPTIMGPVLSAHVKQIYAFELAAGTYEHLGTFIDGRQHYINLRLLEVDFDLPALRIGELARQIPSLETIKTPKRIFSAAALETLRASLGR